jgi:hypothetical protein
MTSFSYSTGSIIPARAGDKSPLHFSPLLAHPAGAMADRNVPTRAAFIANLQELAPTDWPVVWGSVYGYVEACLQAAYAELERLLEIPEMRRGRLRKEIKEVVRLIAERGPEGLMKVNSGQPNSG